MERKLILKKLLNKLTEEEEAIFNEWYKSSPENRAYFEEEKKWYFEASLSRSELDESAAWNNVAGRLSVGTSEISSSTEPILDKAKVHGNEKQEIQRPYWKYAIAASIVLLISFGAFFYEDIFKGNTSEGTIEIGSSKAVLTLEDGTEITLKEGETYTSGNVNSDGKSLVYGTGKEGTIAYNELTIPRGGEYFVVLADSTKVWLNSDTKLKYPNTFIDGQPRIVELLYGEAFFEVSPAVEHGGSTFKVTTRNQEIEVLGTQFNVSAYREDQAVTSTLVEGKVAVRNGSIKKELKPGEQATVTKEETDITVKKVNIFPYTAWKDNLFSFRSKPLKEVMQMLSRWYDIEVEFENKAAQNARFSGTMSRQQSIENILSMVSSNINFEIEGKKVIIK